MNITWVVIPLSIIAWEIAKSIANDLKDLEDLKDLRDLK